jgi:hypothetical protein
MLDELPQNILEVAATKDQQMIHELVPGCPHPSFSDRALGSTTATSSTVSSAGVRLEKARRAAGAVCGRHDSSSSMASVVQEV